MKTSKEKESKSKKHLYQSGAAPYWMDRTEIRVMLVTPSGGGAWILPKGNIAKKMDTLKSAAKEAYEEAGVTGNCENRILGIVPIRKSSEAEAEIRIYPMKIEKILSEWPESKIRSRRLFLIDQAILLMPSARGREVLENLKELLLSRQNGEKT